MRVSSLRFLPAPMHQPSARLWGYSYLRVYAIDKKRAAHFTEIVIPACDVASPT
jgi:hypothetical protein